MKIRRKIIKIFLILFVGLTCLDFKGLYAYENRNANYMSQLHKTDSHIQSETSHINQYLDSSGNVDRRKLGFFENMILSDDNETAKEEIKQLYIAGLIPSLDTHLGDKLDLGSFFDLFTFIILKNTFIALFNLISFIFCTVPALLLIKMQFSSFLLNISTFIQDLIINKFLFSGGNLSVISIFIAVFTFLALALVIVRGYKLSPKIVLKNLVCVLFLSICVGTFISNSVLIHQKIQSAVQKPLDTLIPATDLSSEIAQKSLIYKIFQEQPFLMRHFGVAKPENIVTEGNDKETPIQQYERLLLGYSNCQKEFGAENYAIHQGEPKTSNPKSCNNKNIKHRSRKGQEINTLTISLMSLLNNLAFALPVMLFLFTLVLLTLMSHLRPVFAIFSSLKTLMNADFRGFFSIIFQTVIWFMVLPIIFVVVRFMLYTVIECSVFMQNVNVGIVAIINCILLTFTIVVLKNLPKYIKKIMNLITNITKFAIDSVNPNTNILHSGMTHLVQPTINNLKDVKVDFLRVMTDVEKEEGMEERNRHIQEKKYPKGDEQIIDVENEKPLSKTADTSDTKQNIEDTTSEDTNEEKDEVKETNGESDIHKEDDIEKEETKQQTTEESLLQEKDILTENTTETKNNLPKDSDKTDQEIKGDENIMEEDYWNLENENMINDDITSNEVSNSIQSYEYDDMNNFTNIDVDTNSKYTDLKKINEENILYKTNNKDIYDSMSNRPSIKEFNPYPYSELDLTDEERNAHDIASDSSIIEGDTYETLS